MGRRAAAQMQILGDGGCLVERDADGGEELEEADDERGAVVGLNKGGGEGGAG